MKEDLSQNKKAQKPEEQKAPEAFDAASSRSFSHNEEDEDFELLDALEHMDQAESLEEDQAIEDDRMIELTLDDEDAILDDEEESGFHFDEQMSAGLEQELLDQSPDADFDKSFEADMGEAELGEDSFVLDLNEEDEQFSELAFSSETDLEKDEEPGAAEFEASFGFEQDAEEASASEKALLEFGLEEKDEYGGDFEDQEESFDLEDFSDTERPDKQQVSEERDEAIEIAEDFADLESEMNIEDQELFAQEIPEIDVELESDEFEGNAVITVGQDQVINLGNTEDLEQEEKAFETEFESEFAEQDQEEEFLASYDDLDLEAEATKSLEDMERLGRVDLTGEIPETEIELEHDFDLDLEEEMDEEDDVDVVSLIENAADSVIAQEFTEERIEEEWVEEQEITPPALETPQKPDYLPEKAEEQVSLENDALKLLDLPLRLSGEQMEEFEQMIHEAKTLQNYLDGLETHQTEIKKKIYHKLRDEYISRQKDIFRAPEFTTLLTDVHQDLQDMLAKQAEFASTVEHLNEELEEITVRHLVGEYDQRTLDEKQTSQKTEIALWKNKNETIGRVINRYQELLEAEHTLNPLRAEQEKQHSDLAPLAEQQETTAFSDWQDEQQPEETDEAFVDQDMKESLTDEESLLEEMPELQKTEEEFFEGSYEDDFDLDALSKVAEQLVEDTPEEEQEEFEEEETAQAEMILCKKCGRQTPASEKFCTHCGAKAR